MKKFIFALTILALCAAPVAALAGTSTADTIDVSDDSPQVTSTKWTYDNTSKVYTVTAENRYTRGRACWRWRRCVC